MIEKIISSFQASNYDFREYANPSDPLADTFSQWVDYYRLKRAIAETLKPESILEIGVRFGYSARAFLDACPNACYVGIDADVPEYGGVPGAISWAEEALRSFKAELIRADSQLLESLPGGTYDLAHLDGCQNGDGTFNDLNLAIFQARYILIDGYYWSRDNFLAVNEWLLLNKNAISWHIAIPGYAGELLIKTNELFKDYQANDCKTSLALQNLYTSDYYLNDCGGFHDWCKYHGKQLEDIRLRAVADVAMAAVHNPRHVLDLGCGRGEVAYCFANQGIRVTAVDYAEQSVKLTEKTFSGNIEACKNLRLFCRDVLDPTIYEEEYDLIIASDLVEHLAEQELDQLCYLASNNLKLTAGFLVIHTAPNHWHYRYGHMWQRKMARKAGFWLPKTRRTVYERLMHINEQSPNRLKKQLLNYFPSVLIWFLDDDNPGGSLIRPYGINDMRSSTSFFAVASFREISKSSFVYMFSMPPLAEKEAAAVRLVIEEAPEMVEPRERFHVKVIIQNTGSLMLSSYGGTPFHLSYHWVDPAGSYQVYDGLRTQLKPSCAPGRDWTYDVVVMAPAERGFYYLMILPVQEGVRWHNQAGGGKIAVKVQ